MSRFGLDCDSITPDVQALAALTVDVPIEAVDPLVTAAGAGTGIPRKTSILAVGGLVCEWSNGAAFSDEYGTNPVYAGVIVSVTPRPETGWSELFETYGLADELRTCVTEITSSCSLSAPTEWSLVTLEAQSTAGGVVDRGAVEGLFAAITAAIDGVGTPQPAVVAHRERPALPTECDNFLLLETARSISGEPTVTAHQGGGGGWSDWAEARRQASNVPCLWYSEATSAYAATVSWVREGRWALERVSAADTYRPTALAWLTAEDSAGIRCGPGPGTFCAVDIALGPDWLSVAGRDEEAALALAEAVVSQLTQ